MKVKELVAESISYYMGCEATARELCDRHNEIFREQMERVNRSRYHKMAKAVVGDRAHIYSPHYAMDMTDMFGSDETEIVPDAAGMKTKKIGDLTDGYSLVEITHESGRIEYVVAKNYNPEAKPGEQWAWGHYFDSLIGACKYISKMTED